MQFFYFFKKALSYLVMLMVIFNCAYCDNEPEFFMGGVRAETEASKVYLGGKIWGYEFFSCGVYVTSCGSILTLKGLFDTLDKNQIMAGDVIKSVNGKDVNSAKDIEKAVNESRVTDTIKVVAIRKGKQFETLVKPAYDVAAQKYKLGLWVKNNFSGVGTVTYIKKDGRYGALGHAIVPNEQVDEINVLSGNTYECKVLGVKPAKNGQTGEVLGVVGRKNKYGTLDKNCEYGVYGNIDESILKDMGLTEVDIGKRKDIKTGKAQIFCALNGNDVKAYDIEIIKTNYQSVSSDKSLVFRLCDKALINATGGIVQGMSGSPIVQNGKLIGAVTHVFLNDATKGFGIYIEWMINN